MRNPGHEPITNCLYSILTAVLYTETMSHANVWNKDILLTMNHKCNVFDIISRWVVCPTCIFSIICFVYTTERQRCCFLSWTFHYSISDPCHIWFWYPWGCTADIDWGSLIVTCLHWWQDCLWCLWKTNVFQVIVTAVSLTLWFNKFIFGQRDIVFLPSKIRPKLCKVLYKQISPSFEIRLIDNLLNNKTTR